MATTERTWALTVALQQFHEQMVSYDKLATDPDGPPPPDIEPLVDGAVERILAIAADPSLDDEPLGFVGQFVECSDCHEQVLAKFPAGPISCADHNGPLKP